MDDRSPQQRHEARIILVCVIFAIGAMLALVVPPFFCGKAPLVPVQPAVRP